MTPIIGIDYSMTCPAICVLDDREYACWAFPAKYNGNPSCSQGNFSCQIKENDQPWKHPIQRFDNLARKVMLVINNYEYASPIVYIEGYSMGSKGQVFHIAENTAILKHYLYRVGIEVIEVAPTTVKKFATGSGRAQKEDMYAAFEKKTEINLKGMLTPTRKLGSPVTDIVDAYFIAEYGRAQHENQKDG